MESALREGGDLKETFAEILYDLQWYIMVLRNIFLDLNVPRNTTRTFYRVITRLKG